MVLDIPIVSVPNQSLSVVLKQQNCKINLLTRNNITYFDLFLNNQTIILGKKLTISPILPYKYIQQIFNGNFIIFNNDGNINTEPNFKFFGINQSLIYYTQADLNGIS